MMEDIIVTLQVRSFGVVVVLITTEFKPTQGLQFTPFRRVPMFPAPSGQHSYHSFSIPNHTHRFQIPSHTHQFSVPDHSHYVDIPSHTHAIDYGIYESTYATGVQVIIDGAMRDGTRYGSDRNIDITQWITTPGWHTIELTSSQLGRINASVYIKSFVGA